MKEKPSLSVPFFRPELDQSEIDEVVGVLKSGWLTTGAKVRAFEKQFAAAVGAQHAVALNSCTAALHLAVEALGLKAGDAVLVPAMTFAATAEIVRYQGAYPILVDCHAESRNADLADAAAKIRALRDGQLPASLPRDAKVVGLIPVHVGGLMIDVEAYRDFAREHHLWLIEDAAHSFPAAWRASATAPWVRCGENTSQVACFSFYANKTITTGEGGMAVTDDAKLAARMRQMSLHGLSHDAWERYAGGRSWDYRIEAPGYKYNLTDIAAAIGIHQLEKAEAMRARREEVAQHYSKTFAGQRCFTLPHVDPNRLHSWHLYPITLRAGALDIDRNDFFDAMRERGINCSVHWRPLHLHPYYQQHFGWTEAHCPTASRVWPQMISLPLFSTMRQEEIDHVTATVLDLCKRHAR